MERHKRLSPIRKDMVLFYSTNGNSRPATLKEVLLTGQAPDRGLYMPLRIPRMMEDSIHRMKDMDYSGIAFTVADNQLEGDIPSGVLENICRNSYDFEVPIEHVVDEKYVAGLDRGPTGSFKDFGAQMMSGMVEYVVKDHDREITILTATSGDTGSAVSKAFHKKEGIRMVVLFPYNKISELQEKQITTLGGNVYPIAVEGKFDDCQAMVKRAFADKDLEYMNLTSANSINFGRILPQTVYYFYAYSRLCEKGEEIMFSVPSGNFGNLTGGLIAKEMGLPVKRFMAAVNENDVFPRFLETGNYVPLKPSKDCISTAMNVGDPSNLARIAKMYGGHLDEKGVMRKLPDMESMRRDILSVSVSDKQTEDTIKSAWKEYMLLLEQHGAVAWKGLHHLPSYGGMKKVSLETAHPAKFPEKIYELLHLEDMEIPDCISSLQGKEGKSERIPKDYGTFKDVLMSIS